MGERIPLPTPFGWFRVSESEELARGDVRAADYAGRELVLFRGEDGEAHVLDAHGHRGYQELAALRWRRTDRAGPQRFPAVLRLTARLPDGP